MPAFATVDQLIALLYGLEKDEANSPEVSSSTLQSRLELEATKITGEWNRLYYCDGLNPIPLPPEDPQDETIINLILELLNLEAVATEIIRTKATAQYSVFYGQYRMLKKIGDQRRHRFKTGGLNPAILAVLEGETISVESFVDETLLAQDTPGLTITDHTIPNKTTSNRIAQRESAWIRAEAVRFGYKQNIDELSSLQLEGYRSLVLGIAAPQIERIRLTTNYTPEIDAIVLNGLDQGWKAINGTPESPGFATGGLGTIFE